MNTVYVYMDESGNLGFDFSKSATSKWFVVAFLFSRDIKELDKIVKKIFRGFGNNRTELKSHHGTLHAYKEKPVTRIRLLRDLAEKDVCILSIRLNKQKVRTNLKDEKYILYNYVVNILLDRMLCRKLVLRGEKVKFIAAKRETSKFLNENFSNYLKSQSNKNHYIDIDVDIKTPAQSKGLQIVDCVAWATFRKYEHGDESYIKIVENKIIEDNSLFS